MKKQSQTRSVRNLAGYAGQWVALVGNRVVAHEKSLPALLARVRKEKRQAKPAVFLVPRKDEGPYILCAQ